nr:antitoxin MazE family protein [Acidisphaera sp. S103]
MKTGAARVQRRRDKLRAAGLRPLQIWVPDTRAIGFAEECVRQARLIRQSENAESLAEDEAWAEESDITGWTA